MDYKKLFKDMDEFADMLEKATSVYRGSFSTVYYLGELDVCVKETNDFAYLKFLHKIRGENNKHFPKIYGIFHVDGSYYVFMEKLNHSEIVHTHADGAEIQGYHEYDTGLWKGVFGEDFDTALLILDDIEYRNPTLTLDLRPQNIMERSDGTLVITDPFYDKDTL